MSELNPNKNLGSLLLDAGKVKATDIERIEQCQKEQGLRFEEAALKLGMVAEADIRQMTARQFNYPYLKPGEGGFDKTLIAAYQPFTLQAENLRDLRSQLMLRWFNEGHRQLALVGLGFGNESSVLAANLAIMFAQLGQRTVLVDANLRNPCQHRLFNLTQTIGLSELLVGNAGMEAISKLAPFPYLSVLPAGTLPPNPQEILGQPAFRKLLGYLADNYDVTLLDTPDGLLYADTQNIVAEAGAALLVMHKNQTRMNEALAIQSKITNAKAQIVGVVLNEN